MATGHVTKIECSGAGPPYACCIAQDGGELLEVTRQQWEVLEGEPGSHERIAQSIDRGHTDRLPVASRPPSLGGAPGLARWTAHHGTGHQASAVCQGQRY